MSVSQTSMSSIQKVQQKPNGANKDAPELNMGNGFSSLFAEAMQGRGMSQQFASSELELQNGLGKNDQAPASPPADLSGLNGVASAVQSAIAAQREGAAASTQSMGSQVSNAATTANSAQNNTAPANSPQANKALGNDQAQAPDAEAKPANETNTSTNTQQEATASAQTTQAANNQASTEQAAQAKAGPLPTQTADGKALANEVTKLDAATEAKLAAEMKANDSATDSVALDQTTDKAAPKATEAANTATKADLKADTKADTKVDAKPEETLEVSTRANNRDETPRTETKAEQRVDAKADTRVDLKADTRADQRIQDRPLPTTRADMAAAMVDTRAQQAAATGKLQAGDIKLTTGVTGSQSADGQPGLMGLAGVANSKQAGQATEATIKTPITQPGFAKELGQKLTWAIGKNLSTVDLRVNPEQFGSMNIRLLQKGDQVQLVIRTADDATGALLQQAVSGLKEAMGQQGLQLTNVQIQTSQNQLGANAQFGQQANQGQQGGQSNNQGQSGNGQGGNTGNGGNQTAENETATPARRNPNGNLDLFA